MAIFLNIGTLQSVSEVFTNPYSGETINVDGDYYVNMSLVAGTSSAFDTLVTGNVVNLVRVEDDLGNLLIDSIESFALVNGDDILLLASTNHVLGDIFATGQDNNDIIWSNAGNDVLMGLNGDDIIHGGPGNDRIDGGFGADVINGGAGNDTVIYSREFGGEPGVLSGVYIDLKNSLFSGGEAEGDTLISIENVAGTNLDNERDTIFGDDNANIIMGMKGADILEGGGGADVIDGGDGWDYSRYTRSSAAVHINLKTNVNTGGDAEGDLIYNVEAVVGSRFNDTLIGSDNKDYLRGDNGDDYLDGGLGNDQLFGWHGNDTYYFSAGRDTIHELGFGVDRVVFDAVWQPEDITFGDGVFIFVDGVHELIFNKISLVEHFSFDGYADMTLSQLLAFGSGSGNTNNGTESGDHFFGTNVAEHFDGMGGIDIIDYTNSALAVRVDLLAKTGSGGDADGDTYQSIENVFGSDNASQRDTIWGDDGDNWLYGYAGNDLLEGGDGADLIDGGDGWDYARYIRSDAGININLDMGVHTGGHAEGDQLIDIEAVIG